MADNDGMSIWAIWESWDSWVLCMYVGIELGPHHNWKIGMKILMAKCNRTTIYHSIMSFDTFLHITCAIL